MTTDPSAAASGQGRDSAEALRAALQQLPSAIAVLTARDRGCDLGLTITASSLCVAGFSPPALLISLNAGAPLLPLIRASGRLAVSFLPEDRPDLARDYLDAAGAAAQGFDPDLWTRRLTDGPLWLSSAVAAMDCQLSDETTQGGHQILTARVEAVLSGEAEGLLYRDGLLRRLESRG